jgi:hypothetical protein
MGTHNWYLARIEMTQYALRNTYYGNFLNGKRNGDGTFLYANGTKYEGEWANDLKNGWGKFTYKDGTFYEGYFEDDKMTESPTFNRKSQMAIEVAKLSTRIPSAGTLLNMEKLKLDQQMSIQNNDNDSNSFHFKLDLSSIKSMFKDSYKLELETNQVNKDLLIKKFVFFLY